MPLPFFPSPLNTPTSTRQVHFACGRGFVELVELFIGYDPDMNLKNYDARTPLGEARMGSRDAVIDLIDRK